MTPQHGEQLGVLSSNPTGKMSSVSREDRSSNTLASLACSRGAASSTGAWPPIGQPLGLFEGRRPFPVPDNRRLKAASCSRLCLKFYFRRIRNPFGRLCKTHHRVCKSYARNCKPISRLTLLHTRHVRSCSSIHPRKLFDRFLKNTKCRSFGVSSRPLTPDHRLHTSCSQDKPPSSPALNPQRRYIRLYSRDFLPFGRISKYSIRLSKPCGLLSIPSLKPDTQPFSPLVQSPVQTRHDCLPRIQDSSVNQASQLTPTLRLNSEQDATCQPRSSTSKPTHTATSRPLQSTCGPPLVKNDSVKSTNQPQSITHRSQSRTNRLHSPVNRPLQSSLPLQTVNKNPSKPTSSLLLLALMVVLALPYRVRGKESSVCVCHDDRPRIPVSRI